jgi:predicted HAD superfamily Cof-like phosphohydrolase
MTIKSAPTLSNFRSVQAFHDKMGIPRPPTPCHLDGETYDFRLGFLLEEYTEIARAVNMHQQRLKEHQSRDGESLFYGPDEQRMRMAYIADGLVDLVYVALGMADMMGLPWEELFAEVQRANMLKRLAKSKDESYSETGRGHKLDVVKPEGWTPPDLVTILREAAEKSDEAGADGFDL